MESKNEFVRVGSCILDNLSKNSNSTYLEPCIQINSGIPGPHLILAGGTHGNELVGPMTIEELFTYFNRGIGYLKRGKITMFISNPDALRKGERFLDYDLNRVFKSEEGESKEFMRSLEIKKFLSTLDVDNEETYLLDLHSVTQGDFTFVAYPKKSKDMTDLTKKISPIKRHFIFNEKDVDGTLIEYAKDLGIYSVALECGNHYSESTINVAISNINNFLEEFSMIDENGGYPIETNKVEDLDSICVYESFRKIPPGIRFYKDNVKSEDFYYKGEKIGEVDGEDFIAPKDCYLVMPNPNTTKENNDAGFLSIRY